MKAVFVYPHSSFRSIPLSDTLYGLIFTAMKALHSAGYAGELIEGFKKGDPPFTLSNAFPFLSDEKEARPLLPRPILPPFDPFRGTGDGREAYRLFKKFKSLKYIESGSFNDLASGKVSEGEFFESGKWEDADDRMWHTRMVENIHNAIDRSTGGVIEGILFPEREVYFKNGFYFLVKGDAGLLKGPLNFLSDFGMGGNNSTGKGQFSYKIEDAGFIKEPDAARQFINLSLYLPDDEEIEGYKKAENLSYSISLRRGTIGSHFADTKRIWKKRVTVFGQGSIFPSGGRKTYGTCTAVKDPDEGIPHGVYFMGHSFSLNYIQKGC